MSKKHLILYLLLLIFTQYNVCGQDNINSAETLTLTRFEDFSVNQVKTLYSTIDIKIRRRDTSVGPIYFIVLNKVTDQRSKKLQITLQELEKVHKALQQLQETFLLDIATQHEYLENQLTIKEDLKIGYLIRKNTSNWFLSSNEVAYFFKNPTTLLELVQSVKKKLIVLRQE